MFGICLALCRNMKKKKSNKLKPQDVQRLSSINVTMDLIYDDVDDISENLVDQEYLYVLTKIKALKKKLNELENTLR